MQRGMPYFGRDLNDVANSADRLRMKGRTTMSKDTILAHPTPRWESRRVCGLWFPFGDVLRFLETLHHRSIIR
jgi:hypothetical protein